MGKRLEKDRNLREVAGGNAEGGNGAKKRNTRNMQKVTVDNGGKDTEAADPRGRHAKWGTVYMKTYHP